MRFRLMNNEIPEEFITKTGSSLLATILWNRGYRSLDDIEPFLNPDAYVPSGHDVLPGLFEAAGIIKKTVRNSGKIAIYGDYDVDGITSTALLVRTLREIGGEVVYHIPNRFTEGYGMNSDVIRQLANSDCRLIVTCDCGISNHNEILLAKELGMRVIVTDHHTLPEVMVEADVAVNPKMLDESHPCYYIPGVGVAYLLSQAVQSVMGFELDFDPLQLVALGVICDVVPLAKENRYWAQKGLIALNCEGILVGIKALFEVAKVRYVDEDMVGFQIGPRLNAPGRMASAEICVELLLTDDRERANQLAVKIDALNEERKLLVSQVLHSLEGVEPAGCIVEFNEFWHEGIIGIVAGRLCETYRVPVVLMTGKKDGSIITGSARSVEGVNVFDAFSKVQSLLVKFGGHASAAGLSTTKDKLPELISRLKTELSVEKSETEMFIDLEAEFDYFDLTVYQELKRLAPYGEEFPSPIFRSTGVEVTGFETIGDGKHTRLKLKQSNGSVYGVWWNNLISDIFNDASLAFRIGVNDFNEKQTLQIEVLALEGPQATTGRSLELEDMRYLPGDKPPDYYGPQIGIFAEGLKVDKGTFNRAQIQLCQTLVLATIPPGLTLLKHLVAESRCSKLVLGYEVSTSRPPLLHHLMGIVKAGIKNGADLTIPGIASDCEASDNAIIAGLKLLESSGYLKLEREGNHLNIQLLPGERISKENIYYRRMVVAEEETAAFQEWMSSVTLEELAVLITAGSANM
ncbi:MAG: single-stranded-DNA-specific exonuclease RecJ [Syntrophomonadaceae bacterium]|nr:single-stranded-DNA-specific exonuclease RecJ [Syntrophomonadaceae bacterium]